MGGCALSVLQCMLICFLVEVGEPAHPPKCSQSTPAHSSASSEGPIPPEVTANCKSGKEKSRPVATVCNRPALHNA